MKALSKALLKGIISYFPIKRRGLNRTDNEPGKSARYCYSVWLRHLVKIHESSSKTHFPSMVELGPGSSIGVGILALLTGTNKYVGLDVVDLEDVNYEAILEEFIALLKHRTPIPDDKEFPRVHPKLLDYSFPDHILNAEFLEKMLHKDRVTTIKVMLKDFKNENRFVSKKELSIQFIKLGESEMDQLPFNSADLVFSQAVLMAVNNLEETYAMIQQFLKKGGVTSHQIDFKSFDTADKWNGHWTYSDTIWKIILGRKPYLINRAPYSIHASLHDKYGLKIIEAQKEYLTSDLSKTQLAPRFKTMPDEDLLTRNVLIQSLKI